MDSMIRAKSLDCILGRWNVLGAVRVSGTCWESSSNDRSGNSSTPSREFPTRPLPPYPSGMLLQSTRAARVFIHFSPRMGKIGRMPAQGMPQFLACISIMDARKFRLVVSQISCIGRLSTSMLQNIKQITPAYVSLISSQWGTVCHCKLTIP